MTARVRRQLSLFLPQPARGIVDRVRARVDPVQHRLIPAHVTLCREDEVGPGAIVEQLIRSLVGRSVVLRFSAPERFQGHGILLGAVGDAEAFHDLRRRILGATGGRVGDLPRPHPHITLAHPRNARAPGNSLKHTASLAGGVSVRFDELCLIEQRDAEPWQVLDRVALD